MILSIIIVNYNGINYIKECLDSLYSKLTNFDFEIIIVDNNSSDQSNLFIKKNYKEVILIENRENLGFAKANNLGAKHAKGKYLLLFNNDTILLDPIAPALRFLEQEPSIGIMGIKMLNSKKEYRCSTGNFPKYYKTFALKNLYKFIPTPQNEILKVDWIEGSFMLIPKKVWNQVEGFSEKYFMYAEDLDLCKKIFDASYLCVYYPAIRYIHFGGFNAKRNKQLINSLKLYSDLNMSFPKNKISKILLSINLFVKNIKNKIKK